MQTALMAIHYTPACTYMSFLGEEWPRAAGDLPRQGCGRAGTPCPSASCLPQHGPSYAQLSRGPPAGRAHTGPSTSFCSAHMDSWLRVTTSPCFFLGPHSSPGCRAATGHPSPGTASAVRVALQRVALSCRGRANYLHCTEF